MGVGSGPLPPYPFGSGHVRVCDYKEMKKQTGNKKSLSTTILDLTLVVIG